MNKNRETLREVVDRETRKRERERERERVSEKEREGEKQEERDVLHYSAREFIITVPVIKFMGFREVFTRSTIERKRSSSAILPIPAWKRLPRDNPWRNLLEAALLLPVAGDGPAKMF